MQTWHIIKDKISMDAGVEEDHGHCEEKRAFQDLTKHQVILICTVGKKKNNPQVVQLF